MHSTGHVKILRSENERSGFEGERVYELLYKAELLLPTPEEAEKGSPSAPSARGNELYASHSLDLAPGGDEWDAEVQEVNRRVRLPVKE